MRCFFSFLLSCGLGSVAVGQVLWSNGPLVTHPGAGAGGADVSMASLLPNSAGSNLSATVWRADDFVVAGEPWLVSGARAFAYDTNNATPRWTGGQMQIRAGAPDGEVVASSMNLTWSYSNVNRVGNGTANLASSSRQVHHVDAAFTPVLLQPGTYWLTVSLTMPAGTNAFTPYVMDENLANQNNPITREGNWMVSTNAGATWSSGVVDPSGWNRVAEMPFQVHGEVVPEPATLLAMLTGLGACALRRRLRK
jgi:hypothetical protein